MLRFAYLEFDVAFVLSVELRTNCRCEVKMELIIDFDWKVGIDGQFVMSCRC